MHGATVHPCCHWWIAELGYRRCYACLESARAERVREAKGKLPRITAPVYITEQPERDRP